MKMFGYKEKHEKKNKMRIPLGACLTYLLIATLLVAGVSFSRFASTNQAGDGAQVALVIVDGGSYGDSTDLYLGEDELSAEYSFYVTNYDTEVSEVSMDYIIEVTLPEGATLPEGVDMSLVYYYEEYDEEGEWVETVEGDCTLLSSRDGVYTFDGIGALRAGEWEWHDYILRFVMDGESAPEGEYKYEGISLSVKAEQID